jgi:hypothetical protein
MIVADWIQCPNCNLKHMERSDGLCPRCRQPVRQGWGRAEGAAASPQPGPPFPPAQGAILAYPPPAPGTVQPAGASFAYTVGGFVSAVFTTWGRTALWVVPLTLAIYAPVAFSMHRLYSTILSARGEAPDPEAMLLGFLPVLVLLLLVSPIEHIAIVRAGTRSLRGEPVSLGDMLGAGFRFFFPALGLFLLVGLACLGTACTLYIVPMILLTGWATSLPAMITERLGPVAALKRSWSLTRGLRWRVFGGFAVVVLILVAMACMLQGALTATVVGTAVGIGGQDPERLLGSMSVIQSINMLLQGLYSSFYAVGTAVAYHQLREATEGPAVAHLGRVFE